MTALDRIDRLRLRHRVRVVHAGTGRPFERITARLTEPAWPHWVVRRRGSDVLLSAHDHLDDTLPPTTRLEIQVEDPALAQRFAVGNGSAPVTLSAGADFEKDLLLAPVPVMLEVQLRRGDGSPSTGHDVEARTPTDTAKLNEQPAASGVYSSDMRSWEPGPYKVFVKNQQRRVVAIDHARDVTRVQFTYP